MSGWVQCKDGEVGDVPVCQRKALTCNWPSRITYGYLNSSVNGSIAGEGKAEYKCYSGYKFNSTYAGHVECTNGTIGALPRCYKKQCNWPHIEDGYLSYNGTQRGSTWSKYACYSGFEFKNSSRSGWVKCNDGKIEDQDVPTCQRKPLTCNWPNRISYGYLNSSYNGSTAGEGKAEYKCFSGYEFNSTYAGHVECTNGTIGALPRCYKKQCNWPEIEDGYVKYNSSSWIKYACDYGFEFKNSSREWVRCTDGEIGPLPECQLYCDWPRYIKSGRLNQTYNTSAPGYAKAQYVCYNGYQFNSTSESGWVKCSNGTIPALPSCSEMKCEWPEKIENGYLNNSKTTEAGSGWAKYNCNDNFEFKNSTESNNGYVKCSYGEIGKLPVCEKKSETKIKVSMKLKGKKANKNKFICQMTVKIDGKSVTPDLSLSTAGGIIGYETEDSNNGTELDISKNWKKTSDKPLGMEGWYKPGKKGQQYDCFMLWTVYNGIKATTDKVCWKEEKSVTTIKASLKLKGKKAKKNKFICKLTVKIDGKRVTPEKSLSTAGGIIGFKTVDSKDGTELDIGKNWKQTSDDPLGMNTWYKPGKKGEKYDCFQLWTVYDGIKATTDKVCWN